MIKLPLAISIAETMDAPREANLERVAERLQQDHPEAGSSSEEIAEVLRDAREAEKPAGWQGSAARNFSVVGPR